MRAGFLLLLVFVTNLVIAQSGDLMIMGVSPNLYLAHTVAPKENWYSVGRLFNISPKEIAPYNSLTIDKPLSIGQELRIPLTATNFAQDGNRAADETSVPVYHIVQEKEWMYRISTNYNKVPIENLEKWNGVTKDQAKTGMKLVIGYLKVKNDQSALANKGVNNVKTALPAEKSSTPPASTASTTPPVTDPIVTATQEKKTEPPVKQEIKEKQTIPPVAEKEVVANNPATQQTAPATTVSNTSGGAGYFKNLFEGGSGKSVSGPSGIFKSTSGWQDGKYYALMNNVAVGTIVKVSNPATSKTVYAKVLGQLPEMKESVGLTARISDAAASELGVTDQRFSVEVKY